MLVSAVNRAASVLLAVALFTTFTCQAAAYDRDYGDYDGGPIDVAGTDPDYDEDVGPPGQEILEWDCPYKNGTWEYCCAFILGAQWFNINKEQDACVTGCEKSIEKADFLDADAKAKALAFTASGCRSDEQKASLIALRSGMLRFVDLIGDVEIRLPLTEQVIGQVAACRDARTVCAKNAKLFFEDTRNLPAQKVCIDKCGEAASACNALVTRGDGYQPWERDENFNYVETVEDIKTSVTASRELSNKCSDGFM